VWVQGWGRIGASAASARSTAGKRQAWAVYGGLRTGPVAWLGEVDLVRDSGYPEGRRSLLAALGELNWKVAQGHNLKLTAEYFDPDRRVREDHKVRRSLVYEFTPLPAIQLRMGVRQHRGIPQKPAGQPALRVRGGARLHLAGCGSIERAMPRSPAAGPDHAAPAWPGAGRCAPPRLCRVRGAMGKDEGRSKTPFSPPGHQPVAPEARAAGRAGLV
jgi:hypothetical protein